MDFVIAGAQKSATTALHDKLSRHPDICCSKPKELHIFDTQHRDWRRRAVSRIAKGFDGCSPDCLWGEATPIYMYWPQAIERLFSYNPEIRIIIILRHPVFRALSQWKMETARGAETLSFADAVSETGRVRVGAAHRVFSYVERGFYARQIERLLNYFPRKSLLFSTMEQLYLSETSLLMQIFDFLDLRSGISLAGPKMVWPNQNDHVELGCLEVLSELHRIFIPDIRATSNLTGLDLDHWCTDNYDESFLKAGSVRSLPTSCP